MKPKITILGSGPAGIAAGYSHKVQNVPAVIYEKDADWGGLCASFTLDGFRFDRFVHFTFATNADTAQFFEKSSPLYAHPSISSNYYKGYWLKHPAQNNLAPLPPSEKVNIISDFMQRPDKDIADIHDYAQWLECQYGKYFAHNFPFAYTRKYWGMDAKQLETRWVGQRMHSPDLREVLAGAFEEQDKNFYYTTHMKYPEQGGYRSIFDTARKGLDIRFNKKLVQINPTAKELRFKDDSCESYEQLISSLPLPEIVRMLPDIAKHLWFYIYDEDIPPARVYSPSLKSPDNVPAGCSALQAEVFFANGTHIPSPEIILHTTMNKLIGMGLFQQEDIIVQEIRFEPYANIVFTHDIYNNRNIVLQFLQDIGIKSIGRFGKWDYFWSHQAFEDGLSKEITLK